MKTNAINDVNKTIQHFNFEKLRKKLYAESGYTLGNSRDNSYRDGVDATLEMIKKVFNGE